MAARIKQLMERIERLSPGEIAEIVSAQQELRRTKHEFFDLEFKGRQFRFDVEAINAHIDAQPHSYSLAALELDEATAESIFVDRDVVFERLVALAFNPERSYLLRPLTAILYQGDHVVIDGAHRIALQCMIGSQTAPTRLVPEEVWGRYLMPLDGGGKYEPWSAR